MLQIGRDFHVFAAADGAQLFHARNFCHEAHAASAMDAPVHEGLDERTDVFFLDRALVFHKARATESKRHGLVLQVAFTALIADGAIKRVIDKQEFHHPFAGVLDERRLGGHLARRTIAIRRQGAHTHGARRYRFGDTNNLHEAHSAIACDRKALVIAKARDLDAGLLTRLQYRGAIRHLDQRAVDDDLLRHLPHTINKLSRCNRQNGESAEKCQKR